MTTSITEIAMPSMTRALAAAVLLLLGAPVLAGPERDYNQPPPGASAEDAKLWHELRDGTSWALWELARVAQCSARIRYGRYYELLDAKIGTASADAARAKALREALEGAAIQAQQAIPEDGGRVHPCRESLRDLDQRIDPGNVEVAKERDAARAESRACADRMNGIVRRVRPAADALERRLDDVDAFLNRGKPTIPASEPGAPTRPAGPSSEAS